MYAMASVGKEFEAATSSSIRPQLRTPNRRGKKCHSPFFSTFLDFLSIKQLVD
jgi:hypothetical protein